MWLNKNLIGRFLTIENILFGLLCVFFAFPILPYFIQSVLIVIITLLSVFFYKESIVSRVKKITFKPLITLCFWVLILIISISYSKNFNNGFNIALRLLNIIIFFFLFIYTIPIISEKRKTYFYLIFIFSHVFIIIFLYIKLVNGIDSIGYINSNGDRIKGLLDKSIVEQFKVVLSLPIHVSRYYINENTIKAISIHKAYLSMGFLWSIILLINILFQNYINKYAKIVLILLALLLCFGIIYFTSIPNMFCLILIPIFIFNKIKTRKNKLLYVVSIIVITSTILIKTNISNRINNNVRLKKDFSEAKSMFYSIINNTPKEGSNIRIYIWSCVLQQFKEQPVLGYGIGDEKEPLKSCYATKNCDECMVGLNAHNYYFSLLIMGGLLTLIAFIVMLLYCFKIAFIDKNILFLFFIIIFAVNLFIESMLIRINGVLFFALFSSLFVAQSFNLKFKKSV